MKEIIGDDYPTYEDSVKLTLAEREVHKDCLLYTSDAADEP